MKKRQKKNRKLIIINWPKKSNDEAISRISHLI